MSALNPFGLCPADLAPGETRSRGFDFTRFTAERVDLPKHPWFDRAFTALWREFGVANEMEQPDVLAARLAWRGDAAPDGYAMQYVLNVILHDNALAAVEDHSVIVDIADARRPAVVHVSHIWVAEAHRRTGLAGWVRAMPLRTARTLLDARGEPGRPVTLVAEMEPADPADPARTRRLAAYERAGFRKIDPAAVPYHQPDFRPPAAIDADRPRPVPLSLVIRRVGREGETHVGGGEVCEVISALRAMYARTVRAADLTDFSQKPLPASDIAIPLIPPTK